MTTLTITAEINEVALRTAIEGVEDNNDINNARWSDFDDAAHVAETYGVELCETGSKIIDRAIASEGVTLAADLPAVELAVWGQNFSRSFWDRA